MSNEFPGHALIGPYHSLPASGEDQDIKTGLTPPVGDWLSKTGTGVGINGADAEPAALSNEQGRDSAAGGDVKGKRR
jgi:hypothetical protein